MQKLSDVDWIAEAVVERLDIKKALYRRIDEVRKTGSIVSSNTSTIPISLLVDDMPTAFREEFAITHFFNPVRYMRLLECSLWNRRAVGQCRQVAKAANPQPG